MGTTRAPRRNRSAGRRSRKAELIDHARELGLDVSERDTVRRLETLIRYEVERRRSAAVGAPPEVLPVAAPVAPVAGAGRHRRVSLVVKAASAVISSGALLTYLRFGYEDYQDTLSRRRDELQAVEASADGAREAQVAEFTANDVTPYTPGFDNRMEAKRQAAVNRLRSSLGHVGVADVQRCGAELVHEITVMVNAPTRDLAMAANRQVSERHRTLVARLGALSNRTQKDLRDFVGEGFRLPPEDPGGEHACVSPTPQA